MSENLGSYKPLSTILPAYPYKEYTDDQDIVAIFTSYTGLAQNYLDWFNSTPLGVYTNASISGPLLDWIAEGIYGIPRPVLSSLTTSFRAGLGTSFLGSHALGEGLYASSGTATVANDDIYKRVLTWWLYRGDGQQMSIPWLRRRVARFIYGVNGSDVDIGELPNISISVSSSALSVTVPSVPSGDFFKQVVDNGILALPFLLPMTVTIG